ncbi:SPW repeat protein [Streptomyces litmocidini]|uniref:SPW repeat protein n=1 Tax=Streptomyces TaxID=1883 RepID=UPI000F4A0A26|nr:SPW repeat protein [Streptomyces sp. PanSC19]ROQ26827.1 SPW repeat-containing protein [Streptomyces sp. PanSC19]
MADLSHRHGDIAGHPDASEMRDRYARMLQTRGVAAVEELVILAGVYAAISAWTVHFSAALPQLAISNLIVGISLAVLGLCMSMAPERSQDLNFVVLLMGAWLIVSPWVVARHPGTGAVLSNVITGACVCLFALVAGGLLMSKRRT